jgi:hypothetical protein
MSGLITNPYFKKFCTSPSDLPLSSAMLVLTTCSYLFTVVNNPTASELGNMVAILEIGAFSTSSVESCPYPCNLSAYHHGSSLPFLSYSHLPSLSTPVRYKRSTIHPLPRCMHLHRRWCDTDLDDGVHHDARREDHQWFRGGVVKLGSAHVPERDFAGGSCELEGDWSSPKGVMRS